MSLPAKNKKSQHLTLSCAVLFCSLHTMMSSVIDYSTDTRKNGIKKSFNLGKFAKFGQSSYLEVNP